MTLSLHTHTEWGLTCRSGAYHRQPFKRQGTKPPQHTLIFRVDCRKRPNFASFFFGGGAEGCKRNESWESWAR